MATRNYFKIFSYLSQCCSVSKARCFFCSLLCPLTQKMLFYGINKTVMYVCYGKRKTFSGWLSCRSRYEDNNGEIVLKNTHSHTEFENFNAFLKLSILSSAHWLLCNLVTMQARRKKYEEDFFLFNTKIKCKFQQIEVQRPGAEKPHGAKKKKHEKYKNYNRN